MGPIACVAPDTVSCQPPTQRPGSWIAGISYCRNAGQCVNNITSTLGSTLYVDEFVAGIERLSSHPELSYARVDIRTGYRSLNVSQHIVFYKITNEEVQIIRVLHKSVDVQRHL